MTGLGRETASMSGNERLQKAIEATIIAGYQLSSDAFEYLSQNCQATDPLAIMNMVLHEMKSLKEKPFFIEKIFLENMVRQLSQTRQAAQAVQNGTVKIPQTGAQTTQVLETKLEETKAQPIKLQELPAPKPQVLVDEGTFYPYAKYIPSELKILEDATGKLTSNGTLEEFTALLPRQIQTTGKNSATKNRR